MTIQRRPLTFTPKQPKKRNKDVLRSGGPPHLVQALYRRTALIQGLENLSVRLNATKCTRRPSSDRKGTMDLAARSPRLLGYAEEKPETRYGSFGSYPSRSRRTGTPALEIQIVEIVSFSEARCVLSGR